MKLSVRQLKLLINEEYMRGVPEHQLRDVTTRYVESIRDLVARHIQVTQKDPISARQAIDAANESMKELESEVNQVLEDKLWMYLQKT